MVVSDDDGPPPTPSVRPGFGLCGGLWGFKDLWSILVASLM